MTREEALNKAINIVRYFEAHFAKSKEAREDMANIIEALEQEPCDKYIKEIDHLHKYISKLETQIVMQEPCEDAVSRKAVKEQMIYYGFLAPDMTVTEFVEDCLPSVNPQKSKTGHWEQYGNSWEDKFKCSECGKEQPKILCREQIIGHWSDYCPNCGAKMSEIPTGSERSE